MLRIQIGVFDLPRRVLSLFRGRLRSVSYMRSCRSIWWAQLIAPAIRGRSRIWVGFG
ncbi:hypothetical protein K443DRAFT_485899 [Laccaria amethystina LaAM-08-1]|uniref:Uncharacterized protein n=1 Tax=Laccaria amethystina LaAM-08-1 TaxID=1095629 RepID=A0A0C9X4L0_9AGAR|nr:hypothetical protein K443DRAFT_485899 [Laccaria amethystina LaAM-08-1]